MPHDIGKERFELLRSNRAARKLSLTIIAMHAKVQKMVPKPKFIKYVSRLGWVQLDTSKPPEDWIFDLMNSYSYTPNESNGAVIHGFNIDESK